MSNLFVGRNKEIEAIKEVLKEKDNSYIYIYGPGGIGKTKILNEVRRLTLIEGYICIPIIDFLETSNRDVTGLLSDLISKLGVQYFNKTQLILSEFNSSISEKHLLLRQQFVDHFFLEYQMLTSSKKIILFFDTYEIVQDSEVGKKLIPMLCKYTSSGSFVILAGQKSTVLHDVYSKGLKGASIELSGFTLNEAQYLVNDRFRSEGSILEDASVSKLFYLSNRHPLIIDLALFAILETGANKKLLNASANDFERECVIWIKDLPEIKLQIILQAVILNRRYDLGLMSHLNNLSREACVKIFHELSNYPFIKIDETKEFLGIHDEMRFKINRHINPPNWLQVDLYNRAILYYKEYLEPKLKRRELIYAQLERIHYQFLLDVETHYPEGKNLFINLLNTYDLDLCVELLDEVKRFSQKITQEHKYEIELLEGELNLAEYDPLTARSKFEYLISVLDLDLYPHILARALKGLGECATNNCTIDSSSLVLNLQRWEQELELSPLIEHDKDLLGSLFENMGQTCQLLGMHTKAEEYYARARYIYESNGIQGKLSDILEKIGVLYREQYRSNEALSMFKISLQLREKMHDVWGIGRLYNKMALVYGDLKMPNDAEELYLSSIGYLEQVNDPASLAAVYGGYAWFKFITRDLSIDNLQKAEEFAYKAIHIEEDKGFGRGLSRDYHTLFHILEIRKGIKEAEPFIRKSCDYARRFADPFMFFDTLIHLAKIDYENGDFSNLLLYLDEIESFEKKGTKFSVFKGRLLVLLGHVELRKSHILEAISHYEEGWLIIVKNRTASTVPPLPKEFQDFVDQLLSLQVSALVQHQLGEALGNTLSQQKNDIENWDKIQSQIFRLVNVS